MKREERQERFSDDEDEEADDEGDGPASGEAPDDVQRFGNWCTAAGEMTRYIRCVLLAIYIDRPVVDKWTGSEIGQVLRSDLSRNGQGH